MPVLSASISAREVLQSAVNATSGYVDSIAFMRSRATPILGLGTADTQDQLGVWSGRQLLRH